MNEFMNSKPITKVIATSDLLTQTGESPNDPTKWWEGISAPDGIRDHADNWSLAGDAAIANLLHNVSQVRISTCVFTSRNSNLLLHYLIFHSIFAETCFFNGYHFPKT